MTPLTDNTADARPQRTVQRHSREFQPVDPPDFYQFVLADWYHHHSFPEIVFSYAYTMSNVRNRTPANSQKIYSAKIFVTKLI